MATTTTNLGLRKPEGSDDVNVETDLGNNYDTIDDALANDATGPCCILTRADAFSVPDSTYTMVTWTDSERNDTVGGNAMWSGSGSGQIVARKTGTYIPFLKTNWLATSTTGQRIALITVNEPNEDEATTNDTVGFANRDAAPNTSKGTPLNLPGVGAVLQEGDVLRVVVYQSSGAALDLSASGSGGKMRFGVLWVPPYLGS